MIKFRINHIENGLCSIDGLHGTLYFTGWGHKDSMLSLYMEEQKSFKISTERYTNVEREQIISLFRAVEELEEKRVGGIL